MKKLLVSAIVAFAGMIAFSSCDPTELFNEISGDASVVVTVPTADSESIYTDGQTLSFTSCLTDFVVVDSASSLNNVFLAAYVNLMESSVLETPYMGWSLNDTLPGTYTLQCPINNENIFNINPNNLLTQEAGLNIFVIMASEEAYYLAKGGQISLTDYPGLGRCATGSFDNVQCYYITSAKVNHLKELYEAAEAGDLDAAQYLSTLDLDEYFETVAINGNFNGRRIAITELLNTMGE